MGTDYKARPPAHLLLSFSEGPRFSFLLVSAFHSSLHQCHYLPPPSTHQTRHLLLNYCLLSLRLSCHFHRTQPKVVSTIIQMPHRCLARKSRQKPIAISGSGAPNMPPAGLSQRGISISDVHMMFILTSTCENTPLTFSINDKPTANIHANVSLFADDIAVFIYGTLRKCSHT